MMNGIVTWLLVLAVLILQGCASFGNKSNDEIMATTAGEDFIISTQEAKVNLARVQQTDVSSGSILNLVENTYFDQAFRSNGNDSGNQLNLDDPSGLLLNNLGRYFQSKYDIRFIARGRINNLDPTFIEENLSRGRYVIDVRLIDLALRPGANELAFYPEAAYQFTVVDAGRGRQVLQDTCRFHDINNQQTLRYFSANRGQNLEAFLRDYADDCLRYFAQSTEFTALIYAPGTSLATTSSAPAATQPQQQAEPRQTTRTTPADTSETLLTLRSAYQYSAYDPYEATDVTVHSLATGLRMQQRVASQFSLLLDVDLGVHTEANFATTTPYYSLASGLGVAWHFSGDLGTGIAFIGGGGVGQQLQSGVPLSTNYAMFDSEFFYGFGEQWQVTASAGMERRFSPDDEINLDGLQFSLGVGYLFR